MGLVEVWCVSCMRLISSEDCCVIECKSLCLLVARGGLLHSRRAISSTIHSIISLKRALNRLKTGTSQHVNRPYLDPETSYIRMRRAIYIERRVIRLYWSLLVLY